MAVVKNLMVRVGADLSGFSAGMAKAGNSVGNFSKRTKQAMKDSASSMSALKNGNQNIIQLEEKLEDLISAYQSIESVSDRLNLATPLEQQIAAAETKLHNLKRSMDATETRGHKLVSTLESLEKEKADLETTKFGQSVNYEMHPTDTLRQSMQETDRQLEAIQKRIANQTTYVENARKKWAELWKESKAAEKQLEALVEVAEEIGNKNIAYASEQGLKDLRKEIEKTESAHNAAVEQAKETNFISSLKNAMSQGDNNKEIISLTDQFAELESKQKLLKSMGFSWGYEGFEKNEALLKDLKSQLQEYIASLNTPVDGPEQWIAQLRELQGVQAGLKRGTDEFQANAATLETLNTKVREWTAGLQESVDAAMPLGAQLDAAKAALKEMEAAGLTVGDGPWNQMYQEVSRLTQAVDEYKTSLTQAEESTGGLGSRLKSMASGTVSGLKSIGSRLREIGTHAKSSTSGADKLASALKKIGLTHVALRLVRSVTGELRSIVSGYIAENEELQSQVDSLKSSLGQALAPAINIVTNALSALMPYIVGVSNAIGNLIANLFGSGWTTVAEGANAAAGATSSAAAAQEKYNRTLAGFDEITKLSDSDSSGSSSTSTAVEGTLPEWLSDLGSRIQAAIEADDWEGVGIAVADKLGEAVDKARTKLDDPAFTGKVSSMVSKATGVINGFFAEMSYSDETTNSIAWETGAMIGDAIGLGLSTAHQFLTETDFKSLGKTVAQLLNGGLSSLSESDTSLGTVIADLINAGVRAAGGFLENADWSELGRAIVRNLKDLIQNIDYAEIFSGLGNLLGGIGVAIWTIISDEITGVKDYFSENIEEAGGSIGKGILNGIKKALLGGVDWILDNALIPFVEGLAEQWDGTWLGDKLNTALGGLNEFDLYIEGKLAGLDTSAVDGKPISVTGNVTKSKISLRTNDRVIATTANYTSAVDAIPLSDKIIGATARYSSAENNLAADDLTLNVWARYARIQNALTSGQTTLDTTARYSRSTNSLSSAQTTLATTANYTRSTNSLNSRQTTLATTANYTRSTNSLNSRQTTLDTTARYSRSTNSLSSAQTTLDTTANLTRVLKNTGVPVIDTTANLTRYKDSLPSKTLAFTASVNKGWTGSFERYLGITDVSSKLKLTVSPSSFDWIGTRDGGLSSVSLGKISVRANAKGGILDGAQLFGMIGNTLQIGGEAGREALLPLDQNTGWMDQIADRVVQKIGGTQSGDANITIQLVLDGRVITQTVVRNINATARATGRNPLTATL